MECSAFTDDIFISALARLTIHDAPFLLDSKLIDPTDAAARFFALSLALDPDTTYEEVSDALTEYNRHPELAAVVAELGSTGFVRRLGSETFDEEFCRAAGEGRIEMMNVLRSWDTAGECQLEATTDLKNFGARRYDDALICAAKTGQIEAMTLLKSWGARSYDWPLYYAAGNGQIKAMKLLRNWGATYWYMAFNAASRTRNVEAMNLLQTWTRL